MEENHQDKREGKLTTTEDNLHLLSSRDQRGPDSPQNNRVRVIIKRLGVFGYDKETKEYTPDGQLVKITKEYQLGKTFWDWLQLLIIPLLLVGVTIGFGWWQTHLADLQHQIDLKIAQDNRQTDLKIADDQQQEATLKSYLDDITTLLFDRKLGSQEVADKAASVEAAVIARAKTLTVLSRLNAERKATVLKFLYEEGLIGYCNLTPTGNCLKYIRPIIDLREADLRKVDLYRANLAGVNLSFAYLGGAYLVHANLTDAFLDEADIAGANLINANLTGATLTQGQLDQVYTCKGAILPPGLTCHFNQSPP